MGYDLTTLGGRVRAYRDMLWKDHAYLRLGFQNAHWVGTDLVRTNQPWPFQLRWWRDQGVRTVINLRGAGYETGAFVLERGRLRAAGTGAGQLRRRLARRPFARAGGGGGADVRDRPLPPP